MPKLELVKPSHAQLVLDAMRGGVTTKATNERYTPKPELDLVRRMGPIGLDPCTTPWNPTRARRFIALPDNGLEHSWGELAEGDLTFVNPPYSRGDIDEWVEKIIREAALGVEMVTLTSLDMSTGWGQLLLGAADALCFPRGRIAYHRPDGDYDAGAKQPSLFAYFGDRVRKYHREFSVRGRVLTRGMWG